MKRILLLLICLFLCILPSCMQVRIDSVPAFTTSGPTDAVLPTAYTEEHTPDGNALVPTATPTANETSAQIDFTTSTPVQTETLWPTETPVPSNTLVPGDTPYVTVPATHILDSTPSYTTEPAAVATATPHICEYYVASRTEPTYHDDGCIVYKCTCGNSYTESIPMFVCLHDKLIINTYNATCTENGTVVKHCETCGWQASETIPATGHSYEMTADVRPNCGRIGYQTFKCKVCDNEYKQTFAIVGEHHFMDAGIIKEATATEPGLRKLKCSVCGKEITDSIPAVSKKINLDEKHPYDVFTSMPEPSRQVIYDMLAAYERNKDLYFPEDHTNDLIYAPIPDGDWDYDFVSSTKTAIFLAYGISYDDWGLTYAVSVPKPVNHPKSYILRSNTIIPISEIPDNGIVYMYYEGLVKWTETYHDNQAQVRAILEQMNDGTDLDIVQQIFAYCDEHFTYDASVATLSDLLKLKRGSCNAMSSFVRMACAMCGIKVDQIIGFNDDYTYYHAWNRIWLNGQWTFWDATNIRKRNLKTMSGVHPKALNRLFPSIEEAASMSDIDMFQ